MSAGKNKTEHGELDEDIDSKHITCSLHSMLRAPSLAFLILNLLLSLSDAGLIPSSPLLVLGN